MASIELPGKSGVYWVTTQDGMGLRLYYQLSRDIWWDPYSIPIKKVGEGNKLSFRWQPRGQKIIQWKPSQI